MKTTPRRVAANTALVLGSLLVTLLILEVSLRVMAAFDHNNLDTLMSKGDVPETRDMRLGDFIRLHPDNLVVYELRPGTRGEFMGQPLSINSFGMRDRERTLKKTPGMFRVVTLGDSHTFGWGVRQEEAYPAVLEELLKSKDQGRQFEVMNLGVPGYNAVQEVHAFSLKAKELSPDLVIINFVLNDMDLPNFLAIPPDPMALDKSYLQDFIWRRSELMKGKFLPPVGLTPVFPETGNKQLRLPEERIPKHFRPLYGWDNMINAYRKLADICRTMDIPFVLLLNLDDYRYRLYGHTPTVIPHHVRDLLSIWQELGYLVVDPQDRIFEYLQQNGLETEAVWVSKEDSHSNVIRHRFVAEELFEQLTKAGLL